MSENRCLICGAVIPEGRQLCPNCEKPKRHATTLPTTQELKILPEYFQPVKYGLKTFEVRSTKDRSFKVGERLLLREYNAACGEYTGDSVTVLVTYILDGGNYGIAEGYAVLSIRLLGGGNRESE